MADSVGQAGLLPGTLDLLIRTAVSLGRPRGGGRSLAATPQEGG